MIKLRNVSYTYPNGVKALKNVNLEIKAGEKVFICGRTGCGKSTLLRLFNGLIPNFYGGRVYGEIYSFGKPSPKQVFFISQHPEEQILMNSVKDEILLSLQEPKNIENIRELLETFEIEILNKKTNELSDGEKQILIVVPALLSKKPCIVLDEPFSHLHPKIAKKILNLILESDKTVVMSEHRIELAKKFDRVVSIGNLDFDKISFTQRKSSDCREEYAVELNSVSFGYSKKLFEDFNLKIPKGCICAITGLNGSGKTTLLKMVAGLIKVDGIRVNGRVSLALQYPNYHFSENSVKKEVKGKWLKILGLDNLKDRHPHSLSGGEAKRVSIAKTLDANVILLDEPTAGQDYEFRKRLIDILRELKKTVLIATHDSRLAAMCDKIVEL